MLTLSSWRAGPPLPGVGHTVGSGAELSALRGSRRAQVGGAACAPPSSGLPLPGCQQYSLLHTLITSPPPARGAQEPDPRTRPGRELLRLDPASLHLYTTFGATPCPEQTPPPMPGTLSWSDPSGARRVPRGGQGSCQDEGWEAGEFGPGVLLGRGYLLCQFFLSFTFLSCLLWLSMEPWEWGTHRTLAPAILE